MNKFLLRHWRNWKKDLTPKDDRMKILDLYSIKGMSSHNIRYFINEFSRQYIDYSKGEKYLEIGTYHGCSLLSSALFNKHDCIGVDNFSLFNSKGDNKKICKSNIDKVNKLYNGTVNVIDMDFRMFFKQYSNKISNIKIYFYDGAHDYQSQLDGLELVIPMLCENCIIFVDDVNIGGVRKANDEFIRRHSDFQRSLRILTKGNCSPDWWNGWEVITRGYDFEPVEIDLKHVGV